MIIYNDDSHDDNNDNRNNDKIDSNDNVIINKNKFIIPCIKNICSTETGTTRNTPNCNEKHLLFHSFFTPSCWHRMVLPLFHQVLGGPFST